jgi:hypothetical protein
LPCHSGDAAGKIKRTYLLILLSSYRICYTLKCFVLFICSIFFLHFCEHYSDFCSLHSCICQFYITTCFWIWHEFNFIVPYFMFMWKFCGVLKSLQMELMCFPN